MKSIHLVVLAHGFVGSSRDLIVLRDAIMAKSEGGTCYVKSYCASSNEGRTRDGVVNGGTRLASEIRQFVGEELGRLESEGVEDVPVRLSLVGNR